MSSPLLVPNGMSTTTPVINGPLNLRPGQSLAHLDKTPELKYWFCHAFQFNNPEKMGQDRFAVSHGIPKATFGQWLKIYKTYGDNALAIFENSRVGRPPKIDDIATEKIKTQIIGFEKASMSMSKEELKEIALEAAKETAMRRGQTTGGLSVGLTSMKNLSAKINPVSSTPQGKNNARLASESDPRNVITLAVMMKVFCENLFPELIFYWDSSQYEVDFEGNVQALTAKEVLDSIGGVLETEESPSFYVKCHQLHNADGTIAPPVFVIANENLAEDEFIAREVPGLGLNGSSAWLCFAKTRNGCCAFYNWYVRTILVPFVLSIKLRCQFVDVTGKPMRAFVCCDGDEVMISSLLNREVLDYATEAEIDLGKTPANCSNILHNSELVTSIKMFLLGIGTKNWKSWGLDSCLQRILLPIEGFSLDKKLKIVSSIQKISFVIRNCAFQETVRVIYRRNGFYPFDFMKVLSLSTCRYSSAERISIDATTSRVMDSLTYTGVASDGLMDALYLPSLKTSSKAANGTNGAAPSSIVGAIATSGPEKSKINSNALQYSAKANYLNVGGMSGTTSEQTYLQNGRAAILNPITYIENFWERRARAMEEARAEEVDDSEDSGAECGAIAGNGSDIDDKQASYSTDYLAAGRGYNDRSYFPNKRKRVVTYDDDDDKDKPSSADVEAVMALSTAQPEPDLDSDPSSAPIAMQNTSTHEIDVADAELLQSARSRFTQ